MRRFLILAPALVLGTACRGAITAAEALEAVGEAAISAQADALTWEVIEISTGFTLGQALEDAAQELADAYRSQIPCSTVTVQGTTVTTDFGTLGDSCSWRGRTYAGIASVTLESVGAGEAVVVHEWLGLTDGVVTLDGTATVTWDADDATRHVVHEVSWSTAQREVIASGDRTQSLLDPGAGLDGGIRVDGVRDWQAPSGDWHLDIDGVEMRGQDPVPQAGTYSLVLPNGKTATLTFERHDVGIIRVTVSGGWRTWVFDVSPSGEQVDEV
ncbi:hypothetical protein L6R50_27745 [Myxococcota bacterium]|nr:hypothetical protein [Myxococcota bacterium]